MKSNTVSASQTPKHNVVHSHFNSITGNSSVNQSSTKPTSYKPAPKPTKTNIKTTLVNITGGGATKPQSQVKSYISSTPKSKINMTSTLASKTINRSPFRTNEQNLGSSYNSARGHVNNTSMGLDDKSSFIKSQRYEKPHLVGKINNFVDEN